MRHLTTFLTAASIFGILLTMQATERSSQQVARITLGGGCFWCLDAMFRTIPGVKSVVCGYAGGNTINPTYKNVCTGDTGHAEVVQIDFDVTQISLKKLLQAFWECHDPTTLNRQGADEGTQYRSIILYTGDNQRTIAEESKIEASKTFSRPIVTEILPLKDFYRAEEYHQDYFNKNPHAGYCRAVIAPKVKKFSQREKQQ